MARTLSEVEFVLIPDRDVDALAVVEVTQTTTYVKGVPKSGGLMDLLMGPISRSVVCPTCSIRGCDGHYGKIELAAWVLHSQYVQQAVRLASVVCWACARPKFTVSAREAAEACALAGVPRERCVVDCDAGEAGYVSSRARGLQGMSRLKVVSEMVKSHKTCRWTAEYVAKRGRGEPPCGLPQPKYVKSQLIFVDRVWSAAARRALEERSAAAALAPFTTDDLHDLLAAMSDDTVVALGFPTFRNSDPRWIVTRRQLVTPCRTRQPPPVPGGSAAIGARKVGYGENDTTMALLEVLKANLACAAAKATAAVAKTAVARARADTAAKVLAVAKGALVNASLRKRVVLGGKAAAGAAPPHMRMTTRKEQDGKTLIDGKKGVVRLNGAGGRCDFTARLVIATESYDDIWNVGLPRYVFDRLTFPELVTTLNMRELAARVRRGAHHAFGAKFVTRGAASGGSLRAAINGSAKGVKVALAGMGRAERRTLAASLDVGDEVVRTMKTYEAEVVNRQPTLHKLSTMGYACVCTDGRTTPPPEDDDSDDGLDANGREPAMILKLHVSAMPPHNADADGDEMNVHGLQSQAARAEAATFMCIAENVVSTSGVRVGLVQDAVVGLAKLTQRGTLLRREDACGLLMHVRYDPRAADYGDNAFFGPKGRAYAAAACLPRGRLRHPAVFTRRYATALWTGKQVVSMVTPVVTLERGVRGRADASLAAACGDDEDVVCVRSGELLAGSLCAETVGHKRDGLVQAIVASFASPARGNWAVSKWISDMNRVAHAALRLAGFGLTVSIVDLVHAERETHDRVRAAVDASLARAAALDLMDLPADVKEQGALALTRGVLNQVGALAAAALPQHSALSIVARSGAKGNVTHLAQAVSLLGTQHVQYVGGGAGRLLMHRPRFEGAAARTLPTTSFRDGRPIARGFVDTSYLRGLAPTAQYGHGKAGRDGVVATACGTAIAGYASRRRAAPATNQSVAYDGSVRDGSNAVVQMHYGGDDLDAARVQVVAVGLLRAAARKGCAAAARDAWRGTAQSHAREQGARATAAALRLLRHVHLDEAAVRAAAPAEGDAWGTVPFAVACNWDTVLASAVAAGRGAGATATAADFAQVQRDVLVQMHLVHAAVMAAPPTTPGAAVPTAQIVDGSWQAAPPALRDADDASRLARAVFAAQCVPRAGVTVAALHAARAAFVATHRAAIVSPGEGVGIVGATTTGEPETQMSFVRGTLVRVGLRADAVDVGTAADGAIVRLGDFVDGVILHSGAPLAPSMTVPLPAPVYIATIAPNGVVSRARITAVTRHPPNGDMVRVTTARGATIVATLAKSFLVHDAQRRLVVPKCGADLCLGDALPILLEPRHTPTAARSWPYGAWTVPAAPRVPRAAPYAAPDPGHVATEVAEAALHDVTYTATPQAGARGAYEARCALMAALADAAAIDVFLGGEGVPSLRVHVATFADVGALCARARFPPCCAARDDARTSVTVTAWLIQGTRSLRMLLDVAARTTDIAACALLAMRVAELEVLVALAEAEEAAFRDAHAGAARAHVECDAVVSVVREPAAEAFVYDLTVEGTSNFLVDCLSAKVFVRDTLDLFKYTGLEDSTLGGAPRLKQLTMKTDAATTANMVFVAPVAGGGVAAAEAALQRLLRAIVHVPLAAVVASVDVARCAPSPIEAASATLLRRAVDADPRTKTALTKAMQTHAASAELSTAAARLVVDKAACARRAVDLAEIVGAVRLVTRGFAVVTSSRPWDGEWAVHVRLTSAGSPDADAEAAAAAGDALVRFATVRGLAPIRRGTIARETRVARSAHEGAHGAQECVVLRTVGSRFIDARAIAAAIAGVDVAMASTSNVPEAEAALGTPTALLVLAAEQSKVLNAEGRYIAPRHTKLQSDMMAARTGVIRPLNAQSMTALGASPWLRALFERATQNITSSAFENERDPLGGAAERQLVGLTMLSGSGAMRVLADDDAETSGDVVVVPPLKRRRVEEAETETVDIAPLAATLHAADAADADALHSMDVEELVEVQPLHRARAARRVTSAEVAHAMQRARAHEDASFGQTTDAVLRALQWARAEGLEDVEVHAAVDVDKDVLAALSDVTAGERRCHRYETEDGLLVHAHVHGGDIVADVMRARRAVVAGVSLVQRVPEKDVADMARCTHASVCYARALTDVEGLAFERVFSGDTIVDADTTAATNRRPRHVARLRCKVEMPHRALVPAVAAARLAVIAQNVAQSIVGMRLVIELTTQT